MVFFYSKRKLFVPTMGTHAKSINTKVEQTKATTTGWAIRFYLVWRKLHEKISFKK